MDSDVSNLKEIKTDSASESPWGSEHVFEGDHKHVQEERSATTAFTELPHGIVAELDHRRSYDLWLLHILLN